jgi:hypothetical protein
MKVFVIINEQHQLMLEQEQLLNKEFDKWELDKIPANGLTLEEIKTKLECYPMDSILVFASPIPAMIVLAKSKVFVFHNDNRDKVEFPNGKIIYKVPQIGWQKR